jgi:hypothetical protein
VSKAVRQRGNKAVPAASHDFSGLISADAMLAPNQNIENNPMQSSIVSPAWML